MQLKNLLNDDENGGSRAVSPVIGVILMVAITVILAAVIGTFVLGLGDQVGDSAPQASFDYDFTAADGGDGAELEVTHRGGDSIDTDDLTFQVTNLEQVDDPPGDEEYSVSDVGDTFTAGETATIEFDNDDTTPAGETMNIVFGASEDRNDIIGSFDLPDDEEVFESTV